MTSLPSVFKMFKKAFETLDEKLQTKELIARLFNEKVEIMNEIAEEEQIEANITLAKNKTYNR